MAQRRTLARVLGHEIAHMWFGDLVTMAWWDDLWLNESFADWMGDKITAQVYPQFKTDFSELRSVQRVLGDDARPSSVPIRAPVGDEGDLLRNVGMAYNKGKTVLAMMEHWLGPEIFRRGVLDYLRAYSYGTAEAKDLWTALSRAAAVDVQTPLASFLDQPGYPLIQVEPNGDGSWTVSQRRFLNHGVEAPSQSWILPFRFKYFDGERVHTQSVLLDQETTTIDLGERVSWILPNERARGYYRWSVPPEIMSALANQAIEIMTPRERAAFLGNAAALLDNGSLSGADYLELLSLFADDPEAEVISSLISGVARVKVALIPEEQKEPFAAYVRSTLGPALQRFGLERREGEDEAVGLFRPRLMSYLGDEGQDPEVRTAALSLSRSYLEDSSSIDPSLAATGLQLAALDGTEELFKTFRERFEGTQIPVERSRLLAAMGAFTGEDLQERILTYSLEGPLRPNELFVIPRRMATTPEGGDRVFEWLTENFEAVTSRVPPVYKSLMPFIVRGCSRSRLEAAHIFFAKPENRVEGTEESLQQVADEVLDCVNLREREGASVAEYLQQ
jgi:alanyl aminopeptidase